MALYYRNAFSYLFFIILQVNLVMIEEFNILETLFSNSGLFHVAEHLVSYLDDYSVAQCRLVSKTSSEFLANIWHDRMKQEGRRLCQKKFEVNCNLDISSQKIETTIFELWPDWKNVLLEFKSLEDFNVVIYLLQQYFIQWEFSYDLNICNSPIHFAAEYHLLFEEKGSLLSLKIFKILLDTSLDFNVCNKTGHTPLHHACHYGSKEVVELLLDNAVKKGIYVKACNRYRDHVSAISYAICNDDDMRIVKHLYERRKEFDFNVNQTDLHGSLKCKGSETFEIIFEWLLEKGVKWEKLLDLKYGSTNFLHYTCEWNPEAALYLLESYEKYEIDRSVLTSMANSKNGKNKLPIDLAKESDHPDGILEKLVKELEKFT